MKVNLIGVDIGGTKCAITYGYKDDSVLQLIDEERFPTGSVAETVTSIIISIEQLIKKHGLNNESIAAIGISCGGPLDSQKGIIMSPPNLPGWDAIPIVEKLYEHFGIPAALQNDANACALAEWKFGAGRGTRNMVFMTFGTGLGAGLILDSKIYTGANDNAGELGHIRLSEYGPVGYGKAGSFEGFCSGAGISKIAQMLITEKAQMGVGVSWCKPEEAAFLTAQKVAEMANKGDQLALEVFGISARKLGEGLAIVIDVLNPEMIVIGGVYTRCRTLMEPTVLKVLAREALPGAGSLCRIVPAELGEQIGPYSALSVAADLLVKRN